MALQETGDPAILSLPHSIAASYSLITAPGPKHQESGVALLLSRELLPRCRSFFRSKSGRLIGAVLELIPGHRTLLVSAYMPKRSRRPRWC